MTYKKNISIASIGISLKSDIPITLSERCIAFEKTITSPDITIIFHQNSADFITEALSCPKIYEDESYDIYQNDSSYVKVQYANDCKDTILWISLLDKANSTYHVYYKEALEGLSGINPLHYVILSEFLIRHCAIILHSSLIDANGDGIVFTAPSQTGKSTQANLWRKYKNAEILNGDRAIIRKEQDGYTCYGSPFSGSSAIYKNQSVPLRAIVVLRQAAENKIHRLNLKEAFLHLLSEISILNINKDLISLHTDWILDCLNSVPIYMLECRPDQEAVNILYKELREL